MTRFESRKISEIHLNEKLVHLTTPKAMHGQSLDHCGGKGEGGLN